MAHLFSPLTIAGKVLPNRIVMAPTASGFAAVHGFVCDDLIAYYARRARGGVGLIISESLRVIPPHVDEGEYHLGLYDDAFVPGLQRLTGAVHSHGGRLLLSLNEPASSSPPVSSQVVELSEAFILAAWRAHCAGADGVMLCASQGGLLHSFISPALNQRVDVYGSNTAGRLRLALEIIEGIRAWIGSRLIIALRLPVEEFTPGGLGLQDARVIAKRASASGVRLLDLFVDPADELNLARFPGWAVPLVNGVKRVVPEIPVIGSGLQGDAQLADSVIRDGSVDLVEFDHTLRFNPDWPQTARKSL